MKLRSTSGVKMNWPLVAIAFAVIAVPMGVAVIQDLGSDHDDEEILAKLGQIGEITADDQEAAIDEEDESGLERAEDIAGKWTEPAMEQAFFDELFLGPAGESQPALRGPLAAIRWDMGAAALPDLARWPRAHVELEGGTGSRIDAVVVSFPDDGTAERIFALRWGEPLVVVGVDGAERRIWRDPDARLRLLLEEADGQARASFAPYVPARDLIGPSGRFWFETYPILGATPEILATKYGSEFALDGTDKARLVLPGIENSVAGSECAISFVNGKAFALAVRIDHELEKDGGPAVFAALRQQLGQVREQSSDDRLNLWTFDRGYAVTQAVGSHALLVQRTAR